MTSPLEHALSSDGLGGFYVDLRSSASLIHAAQFLFKMYVIGIFVAEIVRKIISREFSNTGVMRIIWKNMV